MQKCLGRAFMLTGVLLEKGMGEGDFVSGPDRSSPESRHRGPYELGVWRGRSQKAAHCIGRVLALPSPCLGYEMDSVHLISVLPSAAFLSYVR